MKRLYDATRRSDIERCELCALPLAADHGHLYEARARQARCACPGCMLIVPSAERSPYRRVPRTFAAVPGEVGAWMQRLGVPVGVAALIRRDAGAVVAFPSAAGLVEAEVDAQVLAALFDALPVAARMEPDVEALLWLGVAQGAEPSVDSIPRGTESGAWVVGIDVVFRVVTAMRGAWVGMTGGPDVPLAARRVIAELAEGIA